MPFSPKELVIHLEKELKNSKYQSSPKQKEWNSRYFQEHKHRLLSDLHFIQKLYRSGHMLEIGALPCHLTFCLEKASLKYISTDIFPERASIIIDSNHLHVVRSDIEKERIPFSGNYFSFIVFNEVFEHLRINPITTLRELHRVLAADGILLLSTPNLYSLGNIARFLLGKGLGNPYGEFEKIETYGHMGHVREYSKRDMCIFLEETGFIVKEHHFKHYPSQTISFKEMLKNILYIIAPRFRPYQVFTLSKATKSTTTLK